MRRHRRSGWGVTAGLCVSVFQAATVLAKQLVAIRKQKTRMLGAASTVQAVGTQAKVSAGVRAGQYTQAKVSAGVRSGQCTHCQGDFSTREPRPKRVQ